MSTSRTPSTWTCTLCPSPRCTPASTALGLRHLCHRRSSLASRTSAMRCPRRMTWPPPLPRRTTPTLTLLPTRLRSLPTAATPRLLSAASLPAPLVLLTWTPRSCAAPRSWSSAATRSSPCVSPRSSPTSWAASLCPSSPCSPRPSGASPMRSLATLLPPAGSLIRAPRLTTTTARGPNSSFSPRPEAAPASTPRPTLRSARACPRRGACLCSRPAAMPAPVSRTRQTSRRSWRASWRASRGTSRRVLP
mmetsp:Transcript_10461/g.24577  ORF Transcript_10461/g.24577 Transcript_10461/m.24577 type:complete len:249 (-) Transcript_10461:2566-3312(-)